MERKGEISPKRATSVHVIECNRAQKEGSWGEGPRERAGSRDSGTSQGHRLVPERCGPGALRAGRVPVRRSESHTRHTHARLDVWNRVTALWLFLSKAKQLNQG